MKYLIIKRIHGEFAGIVAESHDEDTVKKFTDYLNSVCGSGYSVECVIEHDEIIEDLKKIETHYE